jgi:hypothetical protein
MKDVAQHGRESARGEASARVGRAAQFGVALARTESLVEGFDTKGTGLCESVTWVPTPSAPSERLEAKIG